MEVLIIIWAVVIAAALLMEFLTYEIVSTWFAVGGIVALTLAACEVSLEIQIISFVVVSLLLLACLRPFVKKFIKVADVATNADVNIGKEFKLETPIIEGRGTIRINGVLWTAACDKKLKAGDKVVITEISGNKYIVKKAEVK